MSDSRPEYHPLEPLVRLLGFMVFSTIGMAIMALSILSGPLTQYYADQDVLRRYRTDVQALEQVRDQHRQLLTNLDDPSVLERAAINYLNYVPGDVDPSKVTDLPEPWPALKRALALVHRPEPPQPPSLLRSMAQTVSGRSSYQILLGALGAALIIVSTTCFCRPNVPTGLRQA